MSLLERHQTKSPKTIMDEAIKEHNLDKLYVLFSGGKDSVCIVHFIATNYPDKFAGCVFTNVGLGSQDTRKFVIEYCKKMGWKLWMTWPSERDRFYNIVLKYGFGFAGNHRQWMGALKYHSWYYFMKERLALGEKAAFVSGVRKKESIQRNKVRQYTKKPVDVDYKLIFIKPFLYKNGVQLWEYYNKHELKKSPTYLWFNRSGECYCGCFAEAWELQLFEKYDKLAFESIKWLEQEIERHGTPLAKKFHKWGHRGGDTLAIEEQTTFDDLMNVNEDYCGESCVV